MNGLVAVAPGRIEARGDLPEPGPPGPGEVLVRTAASAVSPGSELRMLYDPAGAFPVEGGTGYMAAGTVEAVGEGVRTLQTGDRVACTAGGPHRARLRLPADQAARVPDGLAWPTAACAYWIVPPYRALLGTGLAFWERAAVVGLGPLGLCTVQMLRGVCSRLLAVDPLLRRRVLAESLGATAACPPDEADAVTTRISPTGFNLVVELSGTQPGLELALRLAAPRARVAIVGVLPRLTSFELFRPMQDKGLTLIPLHRLGDRLSGNPADPVSRYLEAALDMVATRRVDLTPLITRVLPWHEAPTALADLRARPNDLVGLAFTWPETDDAV